MARGGGVGGGVGGGAVPPPPPLLHRVVRFPMRSTRIQLHRDGDHHRLAADIPEMNAGIIIEFNFSTNSEFPYSRNEISIISPHITKQKLFLF